MKVNEYITPERISVLAPQAAKDEMFRAMLTNYTERFGQAATDVVVSQLASAEEKQASCMNSGAAIPNTLINRDDFTETEIYLGVIPSGVLYDKANGTETNVVFIVLSPETQMVAHARVLARVARLFTCQNFVEPVVAAGNQDKIYDLFVKEDAAHL